MLGSSQPRGERGTHFAAADNQHVHWYVLPPALTTDDASLITNTM